MQRDAHGSPAVEDLLRRSAPGRATWHYVVRCTCYVRDIEGDYPGTHVLVMSGYSDDAIAQQGELDLGTAFLQRPFAPNTIARRVRELLDAEPPVTP